MNDRYFFRGKKLDSGVWVYGGCYWWDDKPYIVQKDVWDKNPLLANMIEIDTTTIGQNTTRKDIHNNTIYENDIVKVFGIIGVVEFWFGIGGWTVDTPDGAHIRWSNNEILWDFSPANIEVIGNTHDNSELLERVKL